MLMTKERSFLNEAFPDGFGVKAVRITPKIATQLLELNEDNRPVSSSKVEQYARDMKASNWPLNGESVIIAADGSVNDGQHRLFACIEAGTPFETVVVFGVDRDSRLTVDQGRARGAGCYLGMAGTPNAKAVATISRLALAYEKTNGRAVELKHGLTNAEVMAFANAHNDELQVAYQAANRQHTDTVAPKTLFGFWAFLLRDKVSSSVYIRQVQTGENLALNDPAYRVRERLIGMSRAARQARTEAFLRGWINFRDGKPMTLVKVLGGDLPSI